MDANTNDLTGGASLCCESCGARMIATDETCPVCGAKPTRQQITYRVEVYVTVPLAKDPNDRDYPTLEQATHFGYKRDVEKGMLAALKRFEHDVTNIELMDFTVEDK